MSNDSEDREKRAWDAWPTAAMAEQDIVRDLRASIAYLTTELEKARADRLSALGAQQLAEDVVLSLVPKDKQEALGRTEALRRIYENYDKIVKGS